MALPKFKVQIVFVGEPEPEPTLIPQPPESPDDMIGVEIAFRHSNRYLYPDLYIGTIHDWRYCNVTTSEYPDGYLEVQVESPTFNLKKWIPEWDFVCYRWQLNDQS